jgi:transposase
MRYQSFVDLRTERHRVSGIDFAQIPGLDVVTVQTILSKMGLDPGKFRTEKRFTYQKNV